MWYGTANLRSALRITDSISSSVHRRITLSAVVHKDNTRRPRLPATSTVSMNEKSKARRDSARQLIATTNRSKWTESCTRLQQLQGKHPSSNVYLMANFEPKRFSIQEAVDGLREAAHPDMYDCLQSPLKIKFTLNMQTKKKTKFIQKFEAHTVLPHALDFIPKRRVIALCKDAEEAELALTQGASYAGCEDVFSRLEHGAYHWEEYDTVVASTNWATPVTKLRHVLKDRLPTFKNGRISEDVLGLVHTFSSGVSLESLSLEGVPEIAYLDVIIGQLSWDVDRLRDNLQAYFDVIEMFKSNRITGSPVVSADAYCPPTGEQFFLDCQPFCAIHQPIAATTDEAEGDGDNEPSSTSHAELPS